MKHILKFLLLVSLGFGNINPLRAQWVQVREGWENMYTLATIGNTVFAGGDSGVFRSTDYGATWAASDSGLTYYYQSFYQMVPMTPKVSAFAVMGTNLFAAGLGGVFLSKDSGSTWNRVSDGLPNARNGLSGVDTTDVTSLAVVGTNLFAGTVGSGIFLSTDKGSTWSGPVLGSLTETSCFVFGASGLNIVSGQLFQDGVYEPYSTYLSTDNGKSWKPSHWPAPMTALAVIDTIIFAGTGSGVLVSADTGTTWYPCGYAGEYGNTFAVSGTNIFTDGGWGVYLSTNRGGSWTQVNAGLPQYTDYNGAYVHVTCFGIIGKYLSAAIDIGNNQVGTYSHGLWRRGLGEMVTSVRQTVAGTPENFKLWQNYPNPFNPSTIISYQLPTAVFVTLKVYDVLGRVLETLANRPEGVGVHSVTFSAGNLPSGVYLYRLQAGGYSETMKLVVLR